MEWDIKDIENLEQIDILKLNLNEVKFIREMKKFASIGVIPSFKQRKYINWLKIKSQKL